MIYPHHRGSSLVGHEPSARGLRVHAPRRSAVGSGFTLLEIVIVLTLLVVIAGAAVPTIRGLKEEQLAREPIAALANLAKETRLQAIKDKRPYQIAFTIKGFAATRYFSPYLQAGQLEEFLQKIQMDEDQKAEIVQDIPQQADGSTQPTDPNSPQSGSPNNTGTPGFMPDNPYKEWTKKYDLPENTHYSVQNWYEPNPTPIQGDTVKLWVFQPSGIVVPLTVALDRDNAHFQVGFSALTADIIKESSEFK